MTEAAAKAPRRMTIVEMERFVATFRQRLLCADGTPSSRADLQLSAEDHEGFEAVLRFLILICPYETKLRDVVRKGRT